MLLSLSLRYFSFGKVALCEMQCGPVHHAADHSDSLIFNNAVQHLALGENTAAGHRGLFPGLPLTASCPILS